jgi:alpha/beta superfamily hydrolase
MLLSDYFKQAGEHAFMAHGAQGPLEVILSVPERLNSSYLAVLGHPHSLQGGTMNNKVVTSLARVFKELNIASLRFNFRGVGKSAGHYDAGLGESDDMLSLARQCQQIWPELRFILAGFSFGSYVSYRAAASLPTELLISIAPPVHHFDYSILRPQTRAWIVVQGDEDEVVPKALVDDFVAQSSLAPQYLVFPGTGHFFHGKLVELKARLLTMIQAEIGGA